MKVSEILFEIKSSIKSGNYDMVSTVKNRNSKRKYGLSQYDIEDYIASLEIKDLYKGPTPDRDYPGKKYSSLKKKYCPMLYFIPN